MNTVMQIFLKQLPSMSLKQIKLYCLNDLSRQNADVTPIKTAILNRANELNQSLDPAKIDTWLKYKPSRKLCEFAGDWIEYCETENGIVYIQFLGRRTRDITDFVRNFLRIHWHGRAKEYGEIEFLKKVLTTRLKPFDRNRTGFLELRDDLPKPLLFDLVAKQPKEINLKQFLKQHKLGILRPVNPRYYFHKIYLEANFYRETEKNSGIFINELENL
nr:MAG TPA: hypothetical protein [Caudoviricetes sp.]